MLMHFHQSATSQEEHLSRWLSLPPEPRNKVKQDALVALQSSSSKAGGSAAQVVSAIATVELPVNEWPEIIEILLRFMDNAENTNLRIATLQTIGYICEAIVRDVSFLKDTITDFILSRLRF